MGQSCERYSKFDRGIVYAVAGARHSTGQPNIEFFQPHTPGSVDDET